MADEYDAFIKAAQQAIKAQGAEHKQQFNNYLAEYNQTASTPVRDETDKYKVNTGARGGFGTNYIAQSGVANGAGKGNPPRPSNGKPKFDESWAEADNFLRTTAIPEGMNADTVKNTAGYNELLDQFRKGQLTTEEFKAKTGMLPEEWDRQKGRYTTIAENQRYAGWARPDEDVNLLEPRMRDANMNPDGLRSDYNYAAADAAIQAQQKGMAQDQRYRDLMARYNSSKLVGEPSAEPLGPPAPTATQNYGNYYDGRSGNTAYTRYDEPIGPPAQSVNSNSPVNTYQQNQNAGVSGFSGNPQTNPEAAALLQEYDNRMAAHNSRTSPDPRTVYQDAAHGNMTPDQRNASIYDQLSKNGMTKEEILQWAQSEAENYMTPEEAMRFYFYVDNH